MRVGKSVYALYFVTYTTGRGSWRGGGRCMRGGRGQLTYSLAHSPSPPRDAGWRGFEYVFSFFLSVREIRAEGENETSSGGERKGGREEESNTSITVGSAASRNELDLDLEEVDGPEQREETSRPRRTTNTGRRTSKIRLDTTKISSLMVKLGGVIRLENKAPKHPVFIQSRQHRKQGNSI